MVVVVMDRLKEWHARPAIGQLAFLCSNIGLGLLALLWVTIFVATYKAIESDAAINALIGLASLGLMAFAYAQVRLIYQRLADAGWSPFFLVPVVFLMVASTWGGVLCLIGLCLLPTDE